MFYFLEINKYTGAIIRRTASTTSSEPEPKTADGRVFNISSTEYALISAVDGNLNEGIRAIKAIQRKIEHNSEAADLGGQNG